MDCSILFLFSVEHNSSTYHTITSVPVQLWVFLEEPIRVASPTRINLEEPVRVASPTKINLEEPVRVASPTRINLEEPVRVASPTRINLFLRQSFCLSVWVKRVE